MSKSLERGLMILAEALGHNSLTSEAANDNSVKLAQGVQEQKGKIDLLHKEIKAVKSTMNEFLNGDTKDPERIADFLFKLPVLETNLSKVLYNTGDPTAIKRD